MKTFITLIFIFLAAPCYGGPIFLGVVPSGGGGGLGEQGYDADPDISGRAGTGGTGNYFAINSECYGGGGGGAGFTNVAPGGICGGGGAGAVADTLPPISGTTNTGGGGGGGVKTGSASGEGASGGSGIAVIKYEGTPQATGGTITEDGGYTTHTFTSSGDFIFS